MVDGIEFFDRRHETTHSTENFSRKSLEIASNPHLLISKSAYFERTLLAIPRTGLGDFAEGAVLVPVRKSFNAKLFFRALPHDRTLMQGCNGPGDKGARGGRRGGGPAPDGGGPGRRRPDAGGKGMR